MNTAAANKGAPGPTGKPPVTTTATNQVTNAAAKPAPIAVPPKTAATG